jgi:hypothetical protein
MMPCEQCKNLDEATGHTRYNTSLEFDTSAIYGTVIADLTVNGTLSLRPDYYNFGSKNPLTAGGLSEAWRLLKRDIYTGAGLIVNSRGGRPFTIELIGTIPAPPDLPR